MASLKTEVDKSNIEKLALVPVDLSTLSDVVKNDVFKKTEYNKLVIKADNIDATNFVKRTKYEKDGSDFEDKINKIDKKIPDVSGLVKKTDFNAKISEAEGKISSITDLPTNSELTAKVTEIEDKIPDVSSLVKKTDYATEVTSIKNDFVTNAALNGRHKDLIQKTKFDTEVNKINDKIASKT